MEDAPQLAIVIVIGAGAGAARAVDAIADAWIHRHPEAVSIAGPPSAEWPFRHPLVPQLPAGPAVIRADALHEAFVNHQSAGTRLVTTQPAFLLQAWIDALGGRSDVLLLASAARPALAEHAPEVVARRGPFRAAQVHEIDAGDDRADSAALTRLPRAFRVADPRERLALCVAALDAARTAPALLAAASTCMEVNDLEAAARDLDEAIAKAPDWAAPHFERGKLWLRADDMERAADSFRRAVDLSPRFGSAWANLGATLGELDRPQEALEAFQHALAADPLSHQALNNIGVVNRELGRLPESEAAFRRVIELVPDLAFGHYNLGHTLFLQGRYQAALSAYVEGQRRDSERNAVQATRLAMCRLATGDSAGALRDLEQAVRRLPRELRQQLLADTQAIAWALLTHRPDLPGWAQVNAWLTSELAR